jgi:hypothetical protein
MLEAEPERLSRLVVAQNNHTIRCAEIQRHNSCTLLFGPRNWFAQIQLKRFFIEPDYRVSVFFRSSTKKAMSLTPAARIPSNAASTLP